MTCLFGHGVLFHRTTSKEFASNRKGNNRCYSSLREADSRHTLEHDLLECDTKGRITRLLIGVKLSSLIRQHIRFCIGVLLYFFVAAHRAIRTLGSRRLIAIFAWMIVVLCSCANALFHIPLLNSAVQNCGTSYLRRRERGAAFLDATPVSRSTGLG